MANLNEPLALEDYDATQLWLDRKVNPPSDKGLHRQMVDNYAARNQLEELLLESTLLRRTST